MRSESQMHFLPKIRKRNPVGIIQLHLQYMSNVKINKNTIKFFKKILMTRYTIRLARSTIKGDEKFPVFLRHNCHGCKCLRFTQPN